MAIGSDKIGLTVYDSNIVAEVRQPSKIRYYNIRIVVNVELSLVGLHVSILDELHDSKEIHVHGNSILVCPDCKHNCLSFSNEPRGLIQVLFP
ncbi:MAG TPA: hypothetical protein VF884_13310 [Nitrososphaeraceae archaeon]